MNETEAGTTAAAPSYPPGLVEMVRAEMRREIAEQTVGVEERVREQLVAEMLEVSPPEFREIVNNLKTWQGEGHPPNLLMRLCSAMAEIPTIPKSARHSQHGYPYSTVDDVIGACRPVLAKHGIWPNLRVVSRDFEAFNTTKGVGYNGNMTYACTLFNAMDPSDHVSWEMAGMVTNPGEKLDWVAQSQFMKYFLLLALCLERGAEDAESNPSEGPRDTSQAMRARRPYQPPPQRSQGPAPAATSSSPPPPPSGADGQQSASTWSNAWARIRESLVDTNAEGTRITHGTLTQIVADAMEMGWDGEMVEITIRRELQWDRPLAELPWHVADRIGWMFKKFQATRYFERPTDEELAPGGLFHKPVNGEPKQQELVPPPAPKR